jgi:hypothetical protein
MAQRAKIVGNYFTPAGVIVNIINTVVNETDGTIAVGALESYRRPDGPTYFFDKGLQAYYLNPRKTSPTEMGLSQPDMALLPS